MERIDDLQVKNLKIIQNTDLFCFGTDSVLLADFARIKKGAKVADLGTGSGVLMLLMYARQTCAEYAGLEIQSELFEIAKRNIQLNGLEDAITVKYGDIKEVYEILGAGFDCVVSNPPYEKIEEGKPRENLSHYLARKEIRITFGELALNAYRILKDGGRFYFIHKVRRLSEIMHTLKENKLEPKRIRFIHSKIERKATYVLVDSVKGGGEYLEVLPPLILYNGDGAESVELKRIYGNYHGAK